MKGNLYFISGYHKLVYVHRSSQSVLILGGMANFVSDAKNNYERQQISRHDFESYKPALIDESRLKEYPFIERCRMPVGGYKVTDVDQHKGPRSYLDKAEKLEQEITIFEK